jgi:uncharacterized RDD family membrane protein YckC
VSGVAAGLVTPEGVLLRAPIAGPGTRISAKGLDVLIQFVLILVFTICAAALSRGSLGTAGTIAYLVAVPLIVFGYPAIMESVWHGRTLGKAVFGLRVMTRDGAPCRFRHALIRSVLFVVDGLLIGPTIGVLLLLLTRDTVRLGDLAAGTVVIRERTGAPTPTPASFAPTPGLEQLAAHIDVTTVSASDYEVLRAVLLRAPTFDPHVRWQISSDVAARIAHKIGFTPPPGLHPEAFLQTVAAAYQQRHAPAVYQYQYEYRSPGPNPVTAPAPDPSPPTDPGAAPPGSFAPPS